MTASGPANDDDDSSAEREAAIRAAWEAAKKVHLPPGAGGGDGSDPTWELGLAKLKRNDIGNCERFIDRRGDDFVWVREVGWHAWTGSHWSRLDGETQAQIAAHGVAMAILIEANALQEAGPSWATAERIPGETDADYRKRVEKAHLERVAAHRKWAVASGTSARLAAMLREAAPYRTVDIEAMDADLWRFNVRNGTLQLKRPDQGKSDQPFQFVPHDRAHQITRVAATVYDPESAAPEWQKFLDRVQPNPDMQRFLARWCGYCLTGSTREQVLTLFTGGGSNGKTTFIETIAAVLGNYAVSLGFASLLHSDYASGGQATPDLAPLPGARFASAVEPNVGSRLSESLLKQMTGGDRMKVRELNKGFVEFKPQFKLTLACNNKPDVRGTDEGIWRRLRIVPWDVQIGEGEIDRDLGLKLQAELAGVLNWMLGGYAEYREIGLRPPAAVLAATVAYREERDRIGSFIEAVCTPAESGRVQAKTLHDAYSLWCGANAVDPISSNLFGRLLVGRQLKGGGVISREKASAMFYRGIDLNQAALEELRAAADQAKATRARALHGAAEPPSGHPAADQDGDPGPDG